MNCDPAKRYLYIEDFEEKYDVVGMQRSDIEDLLGSPTWRNRARYRRNYILRVPHSRPYPSRMEGISNKIPG